MKTQTFNYSAKIRINIDPNALKEKVFNMNLRRTATFIVIFTILVVAFVMAVGIFGGSEAITPLAPGGYSCAMTNVVIDDGVLKSFTQTCTKVAGG